MKRRRPVAAVWPTAIWPFDPEEEKMDAVPFQRADGQIIICWVNSADWMKFIRAVAGYIRHWNVASPRG